ncbi:hypothetical protein KDA00_04755 [Candidatus Saccharibacteria bacterium]|nr:hypothetical protein [Candidatus Saccharibacteria bacterium]
MSLQDIQNMRVSREQEPIFDSTSIAAVIGELNTEARCIALTSTPTEFTQVLDICDGLQQKGAFDIVDKSRFNVGGILKEFPNSVVATISDPPAPDVSAPNPQTRLWAKKADGVVGDYFTGFAGDLLQYSLAHNRALRTIIGEKVRKEDRMPSIESRLGVLAAIQYLSDESVSGTFTRREVRDMTSDFGIGRSVAMQHIKRLMIHSVVQPARNNSDEVLRPAIKPDGTEAYDDIRDILQIFARFAIPTPNVIYSGVKSGRLVMSDPKVVSLLIQRSYATSTHTGKSTRRK